MSQRRGDAEMTQLLDRTNPKLKELRIFVQFRSLSSSARKNFRNDDICCLQRPLSGLTRGMTLLRKRYFTFFNWTVKPLSRQKTNLSPGNPGYAEGGFLLAQKREP